MKGDFSRQTFDSKKHYTGVLMQQGRVHMDADWNEQQAIVEHRIETEARDVIGECGAPMEDAGFEISVQADQTLQIGAGRYYVDGILCENEESVTYEAQPDMPDAPDVLQVLAEAEAQTGIIYLDVWKRHVTALDDALIREVALGGPDTATRSKTIWQVKVLPVATARPNPDAINRLARQGTVPLCVDAFPEWDDLVAPGTGTMNARTSPPSGDTNLCELPPSAGYQLLENQLYRVEVHQGGRRDDATFKWSRENGSVVTAIEQFSGNDVTVQSVGPDEVLGFVTDRTDQWVEIIDDGRELAGLPGQLLQIAKINADTRVITLNPAPIPVASNLNPKLRRWDQSDAPATGNGVKMTANWQLLEGGIEVQFSDDEFRTGDYWLIPARTVTGEIEWPPFEIPNTAPAPQSPLGIEHHFCGLALVQVNDGVLEVTQDCRTLFPPLTDICAEDVCYDNTNCDVIQATNVQEAIDQLCQMRDLRHHNKHLHGWGIVCGLQVICGEDDPAAPDDRLTVVVRPGYAIDCEGNDIVLDESLAVPIMEMIDAWDQQHPDQPLLRQGDDGRRGEVCLIVERDEHGLPVVELRPYDPRANTLQKMLDGTLLMDFLQECILEPWQRIQEILLPPQNDGQLVGPGRRQAISVLNLLVQLWSPQGAHVYLSLKEHDILRKLYLTVRDVLQSETFCAMFDNSRPFPDYPFPTTDMSTIFDRNSRQRLRIAPQGRFGYSVGQDANIHVYDLAAEELVAVVEVPGGAGLVVRDVAFSRNGRELYAIATIPSKDTVFAVADVEGPNLTWRPVTIICDVELVTLVNMPDRRRDLLAAGLGRGLYLIDIATVQPNIRASVEFSAVGHLLVDDRTQRAYATSAEAGAASNRYTQVVEVDLTNMNAAFLTHRLNFGGIDYSGEDDIAIVSEREGRPTTLYVVAESAAGSGRGLLVFRDQRPQLFISLPNTTTRLGYVPGSRYLMTSAEDFFRIGLVDVQEDVVVEGFALPVQIAPISIAVAPRTEQIYVVNALSPTITRIAAKYMQPEAEPTGNEPPPGSLEFVRQLSIYRRHIIDAFLDLLGGLVQYLKDCFCQHLMVNCPECDEDDEIYLGCVSIRSDEVYKVCNFSQRKYVKSFPTVSYWLSLVPIAPFIDKAVEMVCCTVLPDFFGRVAAPEAVKYQAPLAGYQVRGAYSNYKQIDIRGQLRQLLGQVNVLGGISTDSLINMFTAPAEPQGPRVGQNEVAGKPVAVAVQQFQDKQIKVAAVEHYDPSKGLQNLQSLAQVRLTPGAEVKLYEQDGMVRYYSVIAAEPPSQQVAEIRSELDAQKMQLQDVVTLRQTVTDVQGLLLQRDQEVTMLLSQVQTLEKKQAALERKKDTAKLADMEAELTDLRSFRDEVRRFMEEQRR